MLNMLYRLNYNYVLKNKYKGNTVYHVPESNLVGKGHEALNVCP